MNKLNQVLHKGYRSKKNSIEVSRANTFAHELSKFLVCWELLQNGQDFYTEVVFSNGKRADIVDITNEEAIEILHTESKKRFESKDYPLPTIGLSTEKVLKTLNKYLQE